MKKKIIKALCLLPYPQDLVPGQRFRWEQWENGLKNKNIFIKKIYFSNLKLNYLQNKNYIFFLFYFIYLYFLFFFQIFLNLNYKNFIIFRNTTLIGPPLLEILLKIFNKNLIFDFDDAIHLGTEEKKNWLFKNLIRCDWKIKLIIKLSTIVICGNDLLLNFAKKYNSKAFVVPTTIDIKKYNPKLFKENKKIHFTVGWSGSFSTSKYIEDFLPILFSLQKKIFFKIFLIGSRLTLNNSFIQCVPWNKKNEIKDLMKLDIGIMPLPNNKWTRGKCGLKILQYLSLGIPSIVSNVGINSKIVKNNVNGYLIDNKQKWIQFLKKNIFSKSIDKIKIRKNCRNTVLNNYTSEIACNKLNFIFNNYL